MREIKFRAWDVQYKFHGMVHLINYRSENEIEVDYDGNNNEPKLVDDDYVILEQFTGLKDKNGVDIYEGDIIKTREDYEGDHFCKSVNSKVYFDEGEFLIDSDLINWVWNCEVTGNIHERNNENN